MDSKKPTYYSLGKSNRSKLKRKDWVDLEMSKEFRIQRKHLKSRKVKVKNKSGEALKKNILLVP